MVINDKHFAILFKLVLVFVFLLTPVNEILQGVKGINIVPLVYSSYVVKYFFLFIVFCFTINGFDKFKLELSGALYLYLVLSFFIVSIFVVFFNYNKYPFLNINIVSVYGGSIINCLYFSLIGYFLCAMKDNVKKQMLYIYFGFVIVVFCFVDISLLTFVKTDEIGDSFNYLSFSDKFVILSFFVIICYKYKWATILITLITLFILGSRSSLVIFLLSLFSFLFLKKTKLMLLVLVSFGALFFLCFSVDDIINVADSIPNGDRMISSLFDLSTDQSNLGRQDYFESGIKDIKQNIFTGNFLGQVEIYGSVGTMIHNGLSYLRQFGIIVFILIIAIGLFNACNIIKMIKNNKQEVYQIYYLVFVFSLLSLVLSRASFSKENFFYLLMPFFYFLNKCGDR
ncbi:hypothetical protein P3566_12500 [Vibrio parahaemolyticus]|nr:hypothetical protein [Vibrio parahaemolyticus]